MGTSILTVLQDVAKVEDTVLADLGLRSVLVYYRTITTTGGDASLGLKGTQVVKDTRIVPNPKVEEINVGNIMKYPMGYVEEGDMVVWLNAKDYTDIAIWAINYFKIDNKLWKVIKVHAFPEESQPIYQKVVIRKSEDI